MFFVLDRLQTNSIIKMLPRTSVLDHKIIYYDYRLYILVYQIKKNPFCGQNIVTKRVFFEVKVSGRADLNRRPHGHEILSYYIHKLVHNLEDKRYFFG